MKTIREIDPGHGEVRGVLRIAGPAITGVGLVLTGVGFISFFSSFGTFQPPRCFWCAFLGLPLFVAGLGMWRVAYMGAFARYFFGEMAPVQKDTFNYMAEGTRGGVQTLAQAVGHGLAEGMAPGHDALGVRCSRCGTFNRAESNYCSNCGSSLGTKSCPSCQARNEPDAHFCGRCGGNLD